MSYLTDREGAVQYAADQLRDLPRDCALTMTMTPAKLGGYSVTSVIVGLLDGTEEEQVLRAVAKFYSDTQVNT